MESRKHIIRTKSYRIQVQRNYRKLEILKSQDNMRAFYSLFVSAIPELGKYVETRLKEMEVEGVIHSNFYKKDDFIDDLFITTYNFFDSIKSEDQFYTFLFKALNTLIENVRVKEAKLHESHEDIEVYAKGERDKMREKMATQLDGDIILEEELDDVSYTPHRHEVKTIFEVTSQNDLIESIDNELTHLLTIDEVNDLISGLPQSQKNIATLYIDFHLTIPEIMDITKSSLEQVHNVINTVKDSLKAGLFNL